MEKQKKQILKLYEENYRRIYKFAFKKLGSRDDAQDVAQEVFGRLLRHDNVAALRSPTGYVWCIARNLVREIRRRSAIRAQWMLSRTEEADERPSPAPDPDEAMQTRQTVEAIVHIIDQLPPRCREVFILHRFKGFSHREIAERLNISPKTVENHMVHALLYLRKHLTKP